MMIFGDSSKRFSAITISQLSIQSSWPQIDHPRKIDYFKPFRSPIPQHQKQPGHCLEEPKWLFPSSCLEQPRQLGRPAGKQR